MYLNYIIFYSVGNIIQKKYSDNIFYDLYQSFENIKLPDQFTFKSNKNFIKSNMTKEKFKSLVNKAKVLNKKAVARAMIDNRASIRVMEKIGLKFVKEFWADYEPHSGTPDVLYELS